MDPRQPQVASGVPCEPPQMKPGCGREPPLRVVRRPPQPMECPRSHSQVLKWLAGHHCPIGWPHAIPRFEGGRETLRRWP
jgi:hypothetical protein